MHTYKSNIKNQPQKTPNKELTIREIQNLQLYIYLLNIKNSTKTTYNKGI
jgi:hypothetical protein